MIQQRSQHDPNIISKSFQNYSQSISKALQTNFEINSDQYLENFLFSSPFGPFGRGAISAKLNVSQPPFDLKSRSVNLWVFSHV